MQTVKCGSNSFNLLKERIKSILFLGSCEILSSTPNSPLLIYSGTTTLIYPVPASNTTTIPHNQTIDLSCPGNQVRIGQNQFGPLVTVTCKKGDLFIVGGTEVRFTNASCSRRVNPTVKQLFIQDIPENDTISDCYKIKDINVTIGSIGFTIDQNRSLSFIKICFNTDSRIALYSYYELTAAINYRAKNVSTASFRQDDIFYRMAVSNAQLYNNNQITTLNRILGLDATSDKYINNKTFISRGHLAAKSDFYYAMLQTASYRYINVAPQWSTLNGGNWNQIEIDVRNYASNNKTNLQTWTGTYGIASLPNVDNITENLYLYVVETDRRNSPCFPIPAIFWKLVYDPLSQKGIVLIGHNNPHVNVTEDSQKVCDIDVSDRVTWLNWDKNNIIKGYSYACSYNDNRFQTTVSYVPKIVVKGLLV